MHLEKCMGIAAYLVFHKEKKSFLFILIVHGPTLVTVR